MLGISYKQGDLIEVNEVGRTLYAVVHSRFAHMKDRDDLPGWSGWVVENPHSIPADYNVFPPSKWGYDIDVKRVVRSVIHG